MTRCYALMEGSSKKSILHTGCMFSILARSHLRIVTSTPSSFNCACSKNLRENWSLAGLWRGTGFDFGFKLLMFQPFWKTPKREVLCRWKIKCGMQGLQIRPKNELLCTDSGVDLASFSLHCPDSKQCPCSHRPATYREYIFVLTGQSCQTLQITGELHLWLQGEKYSRHWSPLIAQERTIYRPYCTIPVHQGWTCIWHFITTDKQ